MIKTGQLVHRFSLQVISQFVFEAPSTQNLTFKNKLLTINQRFLLNYNSLINRKVSKTTDGSTASSKPRKKKRDYSTEDNKFLVEQVKLNGYNLETFKKASKTLKKENFYNVKKHYDEIIKKHLTVTHMISPEDCQNTLDHYSKYVTDLKLANHILDLKIVDPKNVSSIKNVTDSDFMQLSKELNQSSKDLYDYWINVIIPYLEPDLKKLSSSKDIKEDVGIILEKRYEKKPQLKKKNTQKEPEVSGKFSDEEDRIIVSYIEQFGRNKESFTRITSILGRGSPIAVERRYNKLVSENEYEAHLKVKGWFLAEDEYLIKSIFELKSFKHNDFTEFEKIKPKDLKQIAIPLKRSPSACFARWMNEIVPTLKTHIKFLDNVRQVKVDGAMKASDLPIHELALKTLSEQPTYNKCFKKNKSKTGDKRLERANRIVAYYESLF